MFVFNLTFAAFSIWHFSLTFAEAGQNHQGGEYSENAPQW